MLSLLEEFRYDARRTYAWLEETVGDVTPEQAAWQPPGRANTIAGTYAHIVRNIDEDVNQRLFRRPMLNETVWRGRTGLTLGMSDWDRDHHIDWKSLRAYGRAMGEFFVDTVDRLSEDDLHLVADLSTPDLAVWYGLDIVRLTLHHPRLHGGEIACLKGLQGAKGYRGGLDTDRP